MSYIGATGLTEYEEKFDTIEEEIDSNANYINTLVGIPDPIHLATFGINVFNPSLYGLVERAEVNIGLLQSELETEGTTITGIQEEITAIQTEITGIQDEITLIQGEITGVQGEISVIDGDLLFLNTFTLPAMVSATSAAAVLAGDSELKANKSLGIWDTSGDNVYHKKSGNVGIGTTFSSVLNNKLEVNGNINIPTGSTFRIGDEAFNYTHLAGTQPVSSKWTNSTDLATNIYYNTGNVGIGVTTAINNKLEVNGNINIPTGSKYKINNVDLSYNDLSNKLTGGTNIQILNGAINNLYSYTLPTAGVGSGGTLGGVRVDNSTIFINGSGIISSAAGTPQVNSDWTQTNTSLKSFIVNKPTAGANISLANNTITNIITGSPTQNIIDLNNNYLIVKDKPDSQIVTNVDVPLTSGNEPTYTPQAFTIERMYPPVRNFTTATTTLSGQTYGHGTYVVSYSSTFGENYDPFKCFNTSDTIGGAWAIGRYTAGNYNSSAFIVTGYLGDWLKIQLPVGIRLTRFSFLQRLVAISCSPKDFKIYGSNDNITWVELVNKINAVYNASNMYEQTTPEITNSYIYYALVVNKIFSPNTQLNFNEWYIYGQETIAAIPEGNPITHKTLNFAYVPPPLIYDFTNFNTYSSWTAYATSIGATYSLNAGFTGTGDNGVYFGGYTIGFIQLPLPNTHNFMTVTFGNAWTDSEVKLLVNGTIKATSPVNGKTTYSQAYSAGDILRIEELLATIDGDLIIVLTNTNSTTNTYTLSVQSGTSIQVNNGTAQYLSGNYTITVGATQSSVVKSGIGQVGSDPYPLQNGSTIVIRYSMLQRITSTINIKKDGLIKYVPASGTNPTTGTWNIIDLDTQPLTQFSGNLPISRIDGNISGKIPLSLTDGNLPAIRLDNIDMSKVATGNLDWSRISSQPALSGLSGNLNWSRIDSKPALADLSGNLLWNRIDQPSFYLPADRWIQDMHAYNRFFLAYNGTTYVQGYQSQPVEFRNGVSTPIAWFNTDGEFTCMFETQSSTNSDHVIIRGNTGLTSRNRYRLLLGHETFTGFHRCYTDDELYNEDAVDIFKNNYKGRIVISTGKIKTDSSREGVSPPCDGGSRETKSEWYSAIDKDGIMIEDAIPIVQLSRIKKDKRVYGVFGSPTRSTNNKNRLIVNSVGEGAICVCNTNENIENGDYIQSSELLGFGEKQDDDILHNYSVAKAVMDCTFELDSPYYQCYELEGGVRVAFIACTYHCG